MKAWPSVDESCGQWPWMVAVVVRPPVDPGMSVISVCATLMDLQCRSSKDIITFLWFPFPMDSSRPHHSCPWVLGKVWLKYPLAINYWVHKSLCRYRNGIPSVVGMVLIACSTCGMDGVQSTHHQLDSHTLCHAHWPGLGIGTVWKCQAGQATNEFKPHSPFAEYK